MTEIALPEYLEAINTLIDEGRPGEAAIHARHILERYPRQLDAYRLLGKALLEQGSYADAADLFQRVLSAYPDDLVAHVGLAIVRKEENGVKKALWHMERAFEIEPYNAAVREELYDLYARRDGTAPEQFALTRPALARLYLAGGLYAEAVAELEAILPQLPERIDLRLLLAEALWRAGRRVEAAEHCLAVLEQLPDCVAANAILAEVWSSTGRLEEAQPYLERVRVLTQLSQATLEGDTALVRAFLVEGARPLPEQVLIERLPEQAALGIVGGDDSDWVEELGLLEEEVEDDFGWLDALEGDEADALEAPPPATAERGEEEAEAEDEELFAWLRDVSDEEDTSARETMEEILNEQGGTAPAELPEWLAGTVEESEDRERPAPAEAGDQEEDAFPDWLKEYGEEAGALAAAAWLSESGAEMEDLPAEETDWDEWLEADAKTAGEELPDWLAEPADLEQPGTATTDESEPLPDWLLDDVEPDTEAEAAESAASRRFEAVVPDDEFELEEVPMGTSEERMNPPEDETPDAEPQPPEEEFDWLQELGEVADEQPLPGAGEAVPNSAEELPEWLREDLDPDLKSDDSLDWLEQKESEGTPAVDEALPEAPGMETPPGSEAELDDADEDLSWLDQIAAGGGEAIEEPPTFSWPEEEEDEPPASPPEAMEMATSPAAEDEAEDEEDVLDWLDTMEAGEEEPDWLSSVADEGPAAFVEKAETPAAQDLEPEEPPAFADEEEGEGEEGIPDWLKGAETEALAAEAAEEPFAESAVEEEAEEVPDWLSDLDTEAGEAAEAPEDAALRAEMLAAGIDVEQELPAEEAVEEVVDDILAGEAEGEGPELDWLDEMAAQESVPERAPEDHALQAELAEEESLTAAGAEAEGEVPDDIEEAMAWLEQLAARQGAPLDELPSLAPEETEEALAWLAEAGEDEDVEALLADLPEDEEEALAYLAAMAAGEGDFEETDDLAQAEAEQEAVETTSAEDLAWMETLVAAGTEAELEDILAQEQTATTDEVDEVPEDLEEAMAWLERLAAQQGAPLDELPSVRQDEAPTEPADAAGAGEEQLTGVAPEGATPAVEEEAWDLTELQAEADAAGEWAASQGTVAETEPQPDTAEPVEDVDEAMAWLDRLLASGQEQAKVAEARAPEPTTALADEIPEDADEALAWLEQLAGKPDTGVSGEPAYAEETMPVVEEPATPAVPHDVVEARIEAQRLLREEGPAPSAEETGELPLSETAAEVVEEEEEIFGEIPEDPDEAMAWLEQLAARQGASLDELPSVQEVVDEVTTPAWLVEEVAREEEAAHEEAAHEEAAREEAAHEEAVQAEVTPATPEPEVPSTEEADLPDQDFDLPAADVEDSLPDWLSFDESGEVAEFNWEEEAADVTGWLSAEEEITLHGPEEVEAPALEPDWPETEARPQPASPPGPLSLSEIPAGIDLDREQLAAGREAINTGDYETVVAVYQSLLGTGEGLSLIIADLEVAAQGAGEQPLLGRLLGDAYMRNGQLHKALAAYREALDML